MQESIGRKVHPGLKIAKYQQQKLGYGFYVRDTSVFASIFGIIHSPSRGEFTVQNNFTCKKVGLEVGDIVIAKVVKLKEEECTVQILQVNQTSCLSKGKPMEGTIKKENVREKMIDSVVMIQSFKPRDIVRAKVISLGDSIRSIYLSTAHQNLGVLIAQHEQTGRLMLPFDWTTMVDPEQILKEGRKVCNPNQQ